MRRSSTWARHALALISLGSTEVWDLRFDDARPHLEQGVELARRAGRPFLEFTGLASLALAENAGLAPRVASIERPFTQMAERAWQTHVRNLYLKLGAGRRAEAVNRARDLGLLAPSAGGLR